MVAKAVAAHDYHLAGVDAEVGQCLEGPGLVLLGGARPGDPAGQQDGGHGLVGSAEGEPVADVLASDLVGVEGELGHHGEDLIALGGGGGDLEKMKHFNA